MEVAKSQNEIEELEKLSEYVMANLYQVVLEDGVYRYDLLNTINFPADLNQATYDAYRPNGSEGWTTISFAVYGTIKLWWVIAAFNQVMNPMDFPSSEKQLKIPKPATVRYILDRINNR